MCLLLRWLLIVVKHTFIQILNTCKRKSQDILPFEIHDSYRTYEHTVGY